MGYTGFGGFSYRGPGGFALAAFRRSKRAKKLYEAALKNRYKPNGKSIEIIGLPSAVFTHITTDSVPGSLTQTTFDTTSRADSAQILLTNSTGGSKIITAAWIRGKPVTRLSDGNRSRASGSPMSIGGKGGAIAGGGYLHDKFVDYERIAQDGDMTFETGNNFVVTAAQVNQLADYYWKLNRTKKHIYSLSLVGFQSWYEPGEWYTLQIGGAGEEEYIDSTVECFDVRCSLAAGGAPSTSVSFREVEENWKFDSNEVARQISAGDFTRRTNQNVVTVAARYYPSYADYYCDGTNDQEEINLAISSLSSVGGCVQLTRGTFNITQTVDLQSNISLRGEGNGTVINFAGASNYSVIRSVGSDPTAASNITNVSVDNMLFTSPNMYHGSDPDGPSYIYMLYTTRYSITNVVIEMPLTYNIRLNTVKEGNITNNRIYCKSSAGAFIYGISLGCVATSYGNIINNNIISNVSSTSRTIAIQVNDSSSLSPTVICNNNINSITDSSSTGYAFGISYTGPRGTIDNNRIENVKSPSATAIGLIIISGSTNVSVTNNYIYNNGLDTGLENTNGNNFTDNGTDTQWAG